MASFRKLLIANRGEIACRVARTARRLGIPVVAVYSEADRSARHVRLADEAHCIGPGPAARSYLRGDRILGIAAEAGADAIHPGYGFLSENAAFAAACARAGVTFVGPPPSAMEAMASKSAAKEQMSRAGVPTLPGYHGEEQTVEALERHAKRLGYPLIIKPSGGGGGKGMQIVHDDQALRAALEGAKRLAAAAFKDDTLILERYLPAPRHVEVQVFADRHGSIVHLFDRDCSVQRRHQKLIEEAPAPSLPPDVRARLHAAACTVAREIGYVGAGTVEFLFDGREFYFMEMNTRLQVEHPVTEAITGFDLVEWQLRVAAGEPLPCAQEAIRPRGHAIEVRLCAEDPTHDFVPSAGTLELLRWPEERSGLRVDAGFETGDTVPTLYDSLLGKIIAHGESREAALDRLVEAVATVRVAGVATNASWLARALRHPAFRAADVSTAFVGEHGEELLKKPAAESFAPFAGAAYIASFAPAGPVRSPWERADGFRPGRPPRIRVALRVHGSPIEVTVTRVTHDHVDILAAGGAPLRLGRQAASAPLQAWQTESNESGAKGSPTTAEVLVTPSRINVWHDGDLIAFTVDDGRELDIAAPASAGSLVTPLPGVVVSVAVKAGDRVEAGQTLLVVEAMKMEHVIRAPRAGIVKSVNFGIGDRVLEGSTLAEVVAEGSSEAPAERA